MRHVLNFKAQFAELVSSGAKRQTIRAPRKRPIVVGDELRLYTGMRTKQCRLLGVATCESVEKFKIREDHRFYLGGILLDGSQRRHLAKLDGFRDVAPLAVDAADCMRLWFEETHGLPFDGVVIRWGALRA